MKKVFILLACSFFLLGCSDQIRTEFSTLSEAKAAGALERGWLPPVLPDGTTKIIEINDVESNHGKGSFYFPTESVTAYVNILETDYGATITNGPTGLQILIVNDSSQWSITLNLLSGQGSYLIEPKR